MPAHPDHLGSSTVITDQTGAVVQRASYLPFGAMLEAPTDGADLHHYFTGKELDPSTSLYDFGARYYDPAVGRFTQPDPLIQNLYDPQTLNPYTYARNNPLRLVDPDGRAFSSSGLGSGFGGFGSFGSGLGDFASGFSSWAWSFSSSFQGFGAFTATSFNASMTGALLTLESLGPSFSQWGQGMTNGLVSPLQQLEPFGMGTNLTLTGMGEFLGGLSGIERMRWRPTLFLDEADTMLYTAKVLSYERPWRAAGNVGTILAGAMMTWDLGTTLFDSHLSPGQKALKATIQVSGMAVTFGLGSSVGYYLAATPFGIATGVGAAIIVSGVVNWIQEVLSERLGLQ